MHSVWHSNQTKGTQRYNSTKKICNVYVFREKLYRNVFFSKILGELVGLFLVFPKFVIKVRQMCLIGLYLNQFSVFRFTLSITVALVKKIVGSTVNPFPIYIANNVAV